ncbi:MAG TPA: type II secretion system F family protein [Gammaproteobacteria bacterium]|nr:type II secretion system F family protein [Gammaproteobacteria bacterium]
MPTFRYRGRTHQGETVAGTLEGDSAGAVADELSRGDITPLEIAETERGEGSAVWAWIARLWRQRVPLDELILFTRQMAALLRAGVPLLRALNGQIESVPNERLSEALAGVRQTVEGGRTLADGLAEYPDVFSEIYVQMIRVGEASGSLEEVFARLAGYLEQEKDTRDRTKQALRYPMLVVVAIVVAFIILNVVVIPKFAGLFAGLGAELPLPTRILIGISDFTRSYGWLLVLLLAAGAYGIRGYVRTEPGRRAWDRWKLRIPVVGDIFFKLALARFTRTFATTTRSGVPVVDGLGVVSRAVRNRYVGDHVAAMREGVQRGDSLYNTARREGLFPLTVLQMVEVGEETGAVDEMMEQVAEYYEREVDLKIDNLSTLIEPVLIAVIGAMVLLLALGIFLPMWDMARAFR